MTHPLRSRAPALSLLSSLRSRPWASLRPRPQGRARLTSVLLAGIGLLALVAMACGSGGAGSAAAFTQVSDSGVIYTLDDLMAIGFKLSRTYPLDGLPGASDAVFGFWRIPKGDPVDYEVRFYKNHEDAVLLGKAIAEEGSGDDAILDDTEATYPHGAKDRRVVVGFGGGGGQSSGIGPKYGDYAIFDNLVVLCGGGTSGQSLERCRLLADAFRSAEAQ